jgi:hypothetical protein
MKKWNVDNGRAIRSLFQSTIERAIAELSSALVVAQQSSNEEEFKFVQRSKRYAAIDALLFNSIHIDHPDSSNSPQ